jgi:hypothetical protein
LSCFGDPEGVKQTFYSKPEVCSLRQRIRVFLLLIAASAVPAAAQQVGKIEALGALTDASVSAGVRQVLEPKGYRISLDGTTVAAEIWLRKDMPAQPKKETADVIYDRMVESTLVGVLRWPQASSDYRGQPVPAGFYTLRYELIPNDGNHLGVAPSRDFLLMIPANSDTDPSQTLKVQEVIALSRQASGTKHPAPLSMLQPEGGTAAAITKDDEDHYIFSAGIKLASGEDMPLALVVKGTAQQ